MARRKPTKGSDVILINVLYEDGSQLSNRKVHQADLAGFDEAAEILSAVEAQDEEIARISGKKRPAIKSIVRVKNR